MPHLICYDIANNNLRTRLAAKIAAAGFDRINKSVYCGTVSDKALNDLQNWLARQMAARAETDDSLIILPVTARQIEKLIVMGTDRLDRDDLKGTKNSLFI